MLCATPQRKVEGKPTSQASSEVKSTPVKVPVADYVRRTSHADGRITEKILFTVFATRNILKIKERLTQFVSSMALSNGDSVAFLSRRGRMLGMARNDGTADVRTSEGRPSRANLYESLKKGNAKVVVVSGQRELDVLHGVIRRAKREGEGPALNIKSIVALSPVKAPRDLADKIKVMQPQKEGRQGAPLAQRKQSEGKLTPTPHKELAALEAPRGSWREQLVKPEKQTAVPTGENLSAREKVLKYFREQRESQALKTTTNPEQNLQGVVNISKENLRPHGNIAARNGLPANAAAQPRYADLKASAGRTETPRDLRNAKPAPLEIQETPWEAQSLRVERPFEFSGSKESSSPAKVLERFRNRGEIAQAIKEGLGLPQQDFGERLELSTAVVRDRPVPQTIPLPRAETFGVSASTDDLARNTTSQMTWSEELTMPSARDAFSLGIKAARQAASREKAESSAEVEKKNRELEARNRALQELIAQLLEERVGNQPQVVRLKLSETPERVRQAA